MISQQEFANLIHQFVASGQAQATAGSSPPVGVPTSGNTVPSAGLGVPGQNPAPPRPFSPLNQGRPSSAPLMMPRGKNLIGITLAYIHNFIPTPLSYIGLKFTKCISSCHSFYIILN